MGSCPSVILYPASWNSTLVVAKNDSIRNALRQIVGSLSITSTMSMVFVDNRRYPVTIAQLPFCFQAATCFGLFNEKSTFFETGELPAEFWPMVIASMSIQYVGIVVEAFVAKLKGFSFYSLFQLNTKPIKTCVNAQASM